MVFDGFFFSFLCSSLNINKLIRLKYKFKNIRQCNEIVIYSDEMNKMKIALIESI